jgi:hypothetical protein
MDRIDRQTDRPGNLYPWGEKGVREEESGFIIAP